MDNNILIGGAAGQGMKSLSHIISIALKRHGYHVLTHTVYMSRIRGGHNYFQIRFSDDVVTSHQHKLNMILALNQETVDLHQNRLLENGLVLGDQSLSSQQTLLVPAKAISKELNHLKGENIILLGAFIKMFDLDISIFKTVVDEVFKSKSLELNHKALRRGYDVSEGKFKSSNITKDTQMLINGNTAIALGAITAGLGVYSAYPMTPATSIMNYLLDKEKETGIIVEQAEDEIAAIHIALGASTVGIRSMTASSGGGLSLMVEALGLTAISETPLVIVDVMRPGPATGLPTKTGQSDLSFMLTASQDEFPRMIIAVRDQADAFYQTIRAFDLADKYQMPVIILNDQYLADTTMTVDHFDFDVSINQHLAKESELDDKYERYKITESGISPRILPGQYNRPVISDNHEHTPLGEISENPMNRTQMHLKRLRKLETLKQELLEPNFYGSEEAETILVGFGSTEGAIKEFIKSDSSVAGLVFGDVYPLPTTLLEKYKDKILINIELNATGQFARLIRMETGITFNKSILKFDGLQINAEDIKEALYERHI
jgi:2-oxoglutarate ferredoxin oxidoreductase subunit alpha